MSCVHRGAYATVRKATRKADNQVFAVKTVEKRLVGDYGDDVANLRREIANMKKLDHPNVVKLYEVYETPDAVLMVME